MIALGKGVIVAVGILVRVGGMSVSVGGSAVGVGGSGVDVDWMGVVVGGTEVAVERAIAAVEEGVLTPAPLAAQPAVNITTISNTKVNFTDTSNLSGFQEFDEIVQDITWTV